MSAYDNYFYGRPKEASGIDREVVRVTFASIAWERIPEQAQCVCGHVKGIHRRDDKKGETRCGEGAAAAMRAIRERLAAEGKAQPVLPAIVVQGCRCIGFHDADHPMPRLAFADRLLHEFDQGSPDTFGDPPAGSTAFRVIVTDPVAGVTEEVVWEGERQEDAEEEAGRIADEHAGQERAAGSGADAFVVTVVDLRKMIPGRPNLHARAHAALLWAWKQSGLSVHNPPRTYAQWLADSKRVWRAWRAAGSPITVAKKPVAFGPIAIPALEDR